MKETILNYLKTISICILIICFLTSTVSFFINISDYLKQAKINKNPTDTNIVNYAEDLEKNINSLTKDLKDTYGENYPALGIVYYKTILHYSSEKLVQNFLFELIAGFAFGNMIYFIFYAKYKKYKLFIALVIALFISSFFCGLTDILTNFVNGEKFAFSLSSIFWVMEATSIPYTIISLLLIVINKIYSTYIEIRYS